MLTGMDLFQKEGNTKTIARVGKRFYYAPTTGICKKLEDFRDRIRVQELE